MIGESPGETGDSACSVVRHAAQNLQIWAAGA